MLKKIFLQISPIWYALDALLVLSIVLSIQYVFDYPPCPLCVGQRFPWVALVALMSIAHRAESVKAYKTRNIMLWLGMLTMLGSTGFGIYHGGVQYALWDMVVSCDEAVNLSQNTSDLLHSLQSVRLVDCMSKDPIILGVSLPVWNAIISAYMAMSITYMAYIKTKYQ